MSANVLEPLSGVIFGLDGARQQELCQKIRQLILDHSLELANGRQTGPDVLDEALRDVWLLEQSTLQS